MISGMGLALGIDYSLFVVSRYREERRLEREKLDAIATVGSTASRAVLFSGSAFVLAMVGMVLVPDTILRSLATGAILVGIVTVLAAITLLPAVLSLLGDGVNAPSACPGSGGGSRRAPGPRGASGRASSDGSRDGRSWPPSSPPGVLVLIALPVLTIDTGLTGVRELPDRFEAKQGFTLLEQEFGVGTPDSVQVVVSGDVRAVQRGAAGDRRDRATGGRRPGVPHAGGLDEPRRTARERGGPRRGRQPRRAGTGSGRTPALDVVPEALAGVDARRPRHRERPPRCSTTGP